MFDFISNLYKKERSPLAQAPGVTRFIDELPADNPAMALEELTHWLTDLSQEGDINLQERVKRLTRIDKSAQEHEYALRRQYIEASRMHKAVEARIWDASINFLEATVSMHLRCAAKMSHKGKQYNPYLAVVIMRAMRRLELHAHWLHLRYCPISSALWGQLFFLINLAEDRGLLHLPLTLSTTTNEQTTIAQEMLKLLMISVAEPEQLTRQQISLARLVTRNLAGTFTWEKMPCASTIFQLDFSKPETPVQQSKRTEQETQSRYFGTTEAVSALTVGLMKLERGEIPDLAGENNFERYPREDWVTVMTHLAQCWKREMRNELSQFNQRHAGRKQVFYRIGVVHDYDSLHAQLMQILIPGVSLITSSQDEEAESWVVENISEMGYGVTLSSQNEDWVKSNTLIGIQADATPWQIGVIRRVASELPGQTQVGVQILSNQPDAVLLQRADADTQSAPTRGIFMHREPPYQNQESVLLVTGSYQLHRAYAMEIGDNKRVIRLLDRINTFQGVDQIIFADVKSKNYR